MKNIRLVTVAGKQIEVADLDDDAPAPRRGKATEPFALVPLRWFADMAKAAGIPGAMVLVLLQYMAWKTKSNVFPLSNTVLARYGIDRRTKYCVLDNLEAAGWIRVEQTGKRSPIVTLLTANERT